MSIYWRHLQIRTQKPAPTFVSTNEVNKSTMKTVKTQVIVNAPVDQVWQTLMEFDKYSEWNPFIPSISGNPKVGEKLNISIHPPEKSPMKFTPIVLVCQSNKEFRWVGKLGLTGIFDGEHYFKLSSINGQETKLIHGENFTGLLSGIVFNMLKNSTIKGFELMNQRLKMRIENQEL